MRHESPSEPFTPAFVRAVMAALNAGLLTLMDWLWRCFRAERRMPAHLKREVRETLRDAREALFGLLVESYAHRLPPSAPQRRMHDHRPRRGARSPAPSHRSAISLRRILKRTLPKARRTLRERFTAAFLILRHFERLHLRIRAMLAKNYTSAWVLASLAPLCIEGRTLAPCVCDTS